MTARRYTVSGRVQGVGFRYFAERAARHLGLTGYTRNLSDGRVEVHAVGDPGQLAVLMERLRCGPPSSVVEAVEEEETPLVHYEGFHIRRT